jgi:hypothetical protein
LAFDGEHEIEIATSEIDPPNLTESENMKRMPKTTEILELMHSVRLPTFASDFVERTAPLHNHAGEPPEILDCSESCLQ